MSRYACHAHGREGDTCAEACADCFAAQQRATGKDRNVLRFRRVDRVVVDMAAGAPSPEYVAGLSTETKEASLELAEALKASVEAPPEGPRFAGLDPGARHVAATVIAGGRVVASKAFEVGHEVARRSPTRKDGTPWKTPSRWVVTDEDIGRLLGQLVAFLFPHGIVRIAVERANVFQKSKDAPAAATGARAALLLRSQHIGGEIAGMLRGTDVEGRRVAGEVVTCPSGGPDGWRATVRKASGKPWAEGVRALLPNLPAGEHVADAAGLALHASRPAAAPGATTSSRRRKRSGARDPCCRCTHTRTHGPGCPLAGSPVRYVKA